MLYLINFEQKRLTCGRFPKEKGKILSNPFNGPRNTLVQKTGSEDGPHEDTDSLPEIGRKFFVKKLNQIPAIDT